MGATAEGRPARERKNSQDKERKRVRGEGWAATYRIKAR
jgi:hypothetical protein